MILPLSRHQLSVAAGQGTQYHSAPGDESDSSFKLLWREVALPVELLPQQSRRRPLPTGNLLNYAPLTTLCRSSTFVAKAASYV